MKARIGIETSEIAFLRWLDDHSHETGLAFEYCTGSYRADFYDSHKRLVARAVCSQDTGKISLISQIGRAHV